MSFNAGTGSDTYQSSGSTDIVTILDDGNDVVSTGRRGDAVHVVRSRRPGTLRVRLGGGNDHLFLPMGRSRGTLDGGTGDDLLELRHRSRQVWTIDNRHGEARAGSEVRFGWRGFEGFRVKGLKVPEIRFIGTDAAEEIEAHRSDTALRLAMGGGDDTVYGGDADDTIDAGPGSDFADGGAGTDSCVAVEEAYNCELSSRTRRRVSG